MPEAIRSTEALARHLGLSRWTVSRVINGHPGVSPETVARVQEAMEAFGFSPNPHARGLRGTPSRVVGLCFQDLDWPILAWKASALQAALRESGYETLIELTNAREDLEAAALRRFLATRVDAVVVLGGQLGEDHPAWQGLLRAGVALCCVDPRQAITCAQVAVDRQGIMAAAVDHLAAQGHRHFLTLGLEPGDAYHQARLDGVGAALAARKLPAASRCWETGARHDYDYGRHLAARALAEAPEATAWLCVNDRVAIGAMRSLQAAGRSVPGAISVLGYDNLEVGPHAAPALSTVDQDVPGLMASARDLILSQIEGREVSSSSQHGARLIWRDSTGPVPV